MLIIVSIFSIQTSDSFVFNSIILNRIADFFCISAAYDIALDACIDQSNIDLSSISARDETNHLHNLNCLNRYSFKCFALPKLAHFSTLYVNSRVVAAHFINSLS